MDKYTPIIGLEIHVELKTKSKMFCQCDADWFGKEPNTHVCPVCLGMPGALPVPNKQAVEWTIKLAHALNCTINKHTKFDRKHYFYPDLPKAYQISQFDQPFGEHGKVTVKIKNEDKTFRICRVHLEEDTGKLSHIDDDTTIDFNRSSVPLVEIVTEADFHDSEDVKLFLEELHTIVRYMDVSDADMEKGSMRIEPNISVKLKEMEGFPPYKVEVKNINSFSYVKKAIDYEVKRHIELLEKGETPVQETRGYNENKGITYSQRTKENAHDYRYFPEPDIPTMVFTDEDLKRIYAEMPELPAAKVDRFVKEYGIKYADAFILTRDHDDCEYYESLFIKARKKNGTLEKPNENIEQKIANLIINKKVAFDKKSESGLDIAFEMMKPKETDNALLEETVNKVIAANPKAIEDYKAGKQNSLMFLLGQVMKEMKGKAEASVIKEKLIEKMS